MLSVSGRDNTFGYSYGPQVIVCGLPRTGTASIKLALEKLGYHNVYHMSTFVEHTEDAQYWEYIIKEKLAGYDIHSSVWKDILGKYHAVVDAPSCYFATDIAKVYPNAKVVILNRDSVAWYDSFANTVQKMIKRRESLEFLEWLLRPCLPTQISSIIQVGNLLSESGLGLGSCDREGCLEFF